jgi:hypothetical protein
MMNSGPGLGSSLGLEATTDEHDIECVVDLYLCVRRNVNPLCGDLCSLDMHVQHKNNTFRSVYTQRHYFL